MERERNKTRVIFLALLFCVLLLPAARGHASERPPLRVAQMPLQVETYQTPTQGAIDAVMQKVREALHVPLNDGLQYVAYVPKADCLVALDAVRADAAANGRTGKIDWRAAARAIGQKLEADLVVIPILTGYESAKYMSWSWMRGRMLHSYAAVRVVVYDAKEDAVIDRRAQDRYDDEATPRGEVESMAASCMDTALRRVDLHALLWIRARNT